MSIRNHNDEPVLDCLLERKAFRDKVCAQIKSAQPPKAMAIHGTWGTGKTSLLRQLYSDLGGRHALSEKEKKEKESQAQPESDKKFKAVWFEAWQYQQEANLLAALLKEIRDQLAFGYKLAEGIESTATVGLLSTLQSIDLTIGRFGLKFGELSKRFVENQKTYDQERFAMPLETVTLKQMLREALNQLLGLEHIIKEGILKRDSDRRVVIFIDDLDRCEPAVAFRILESIKVYLNLDNCIFVLGMDVQAVEHSLAKNYEKQLSPKGDSYAELKNLARLYLEKICQDVYHLPVLDGEIKSKYFDALLNTDDLPGPLREYLVSLAKNQRALPPFARSIKILANVVLAHWDQPTIQAAIIDEADEEMQSRNRKLFFILCYLYAFHPEIYRLCYLYLEDNFFGEQLLDFCRNPTRFERKVNTAQPASGKEVAYDVPELHPALRHLQIPDAPTQDLGGIDGNAAGVERRYPHESLRQVLWIRGLIAEMESVTVEELRTLKM